MEGSKLLQRWNLVQLSPGWCSWGCLASRAPPRPLVPVVPLWGLSPHPLPLRPTHGRDPAFSCAPAMERDPVVFRLPVPQGGGSHLSGVYMYLFFFKFFSHLDDTEYWADFLVWYSRSLLVIYFKYHSVYMSMPNYLTVPSLWQL